MMMTLLPWAGYAGVGGCTLAGAMWAHCKRGQARGRWRRGKVYVLLRHSCHVQYIYTI